MQVGSDLSGGLGREAGGWSQDGKGGTWLIAENPGYQFEGPADQKTGAPKAKHWYSELLGWRFARILGFKELKNRKHRNVIERPNEKELSGPTCDRELNEVLKDEC